MDEARVQNHSVLKKHRRYFIVFIVFVELFISCGLLYNYSILFVSLQIEFDSSAALTGVLAFAPLLNALIPAYGWRNTLRIISGGSLVLTLAHGAFITEPTQDVPDEISCKTVEKDSEEKVDDDQLEHEAETFKQKYARLFHQTDAWLWCSASVLLYIGLIFIIVNFASFMEYDLHFTSDQVSITIVLFAVAEICGKLLLSIIGDLFPFQKLYVVVAGGLLGGGVHGLMTLLRTAPLVYTLTLFAGLSRAVCFVMPFSAATELFGDYGSDITSVLALFPFGIGFLIGAPLSGGLYDLTGDYTLSLLVMLGVQILSVGLLLIIPIRRKIRSRGLPESQVQS